MSPDGIQLTYMPKLMLERLAARQMRRFLVVGTGSVGIDFLAYVGLIFFVDYRLSKDLAKAISFVLGTIFGFVANKFWTFESRKRSLFEVVSFFLLYFVTMLINVAVNRGVRLLLPKALVTAFICATATSTVLNFMGQKFIAFRAAQEHLRIFKWST